MMVKPGVAGIPSARATAPGNPYNFRVILVSIRQSKEPFNLISNFHAKNSLVKGHERQIAFRLHSFNVFNQSIESKIVVSIFIFAFLQVIHYHLSLVVRKPVFGVSDQVRHKPGCTVIQDG